MDAGQARNCKFGIIIRAEQYGKMNFHNNYGTFYMISINIPICLGIQNTIPNRLSDGHVIEVYANVVYRTKTSFPFSLTFKTSYFIILSAYRN